LPLGLGGDDGEFAGLADEVDLAVAADGGAVIAAGGGDAVVLERLARLGIDAGDQAAVLDHEDDAVVKQRRRHIGKLLLLLPQHVCLRDVSLATRANGDHAVLGGGEDLPHAVPFGAIDVVVAVAVELGEAVLDRAGRDLVGLQRTVLVGIVLGEHLVERRNDDDIAGVGAGAPGGDVENVVGAYGGRHVANAGQAAHGPDFLAAVE